MISGYARSGWPVSDDATMQQVSHENNPGVRLRRIMQGLIKVTNNKDHRCNTRYPAESPLNQIVQILRFTKTGERWPTGGMTDASRIVAQDPVTASVELGYEREQDTLME